MLVVQPDTGVEARRGAGGQAIATQPPSVLLTNRGTKSFPWLLEPGAPWVRAFGPHSGLLWPKDKVQIELSIDPALAPTEPGQHDTEVRVLNAMTFHCEARIAVRFVVGK